MKQITLKIGQIKTPYRVRDYPIKETIHLETIEYYSQIIETLPDIIVAKIPKEGYVLIDGWHRLKAISRKTRREFAETDKGHKQFLKKYPDGTMGITIVANLDTTINTMKQAIKSSVEANVKHGISYTESDRVHNALTLVQYKYTQKQIANIFGVDPSTVSKWLKLDSTKAKEKKVKKVVKAKEEGKTIREIAEETKVPVATVHRIVKKSEEPPDEPKERVIHDKTEFNKAKMHIVEARRHMTGLERQLKDVVFDGKSKQLIFENLEALTADIAEIKSTITW